MAKKLGTLIREARTGAGLTQEQLAKKVKGLSASDVSKAERGEKELTQEQLKAIAKATGVTQKSLLEAPSAVKKTAAKKTTTAKTETAKKTTAKKTTSSAKKNTTAVELTAAEKTLLNAYRKADAETQKAALNILKGEKEADILSGLMEMLGNLGKK